jgi:DNA-binding transcriptional ArsR family regulator
MDDSETLSPDAAFATLGSETRFAVLRALAEADDAVSFSALRDRVGMADSGQFNYHLDRLVGHFVERADDGYRLAPAGERVAEAVLSGAVTERPRLPRHAAGPAGGRPRPRPRRGVPDRLDVGEPGDPRAVE